MKSSSVNYQKIIGTYLRPYWRQAAGLGALLLLGLGLRLVNPKLLSAFIDLAIEDAPLVELFKYALWFSGIALLLQVIVVAETYLAANLGQLTTNQLRKDLLRHCLKLDMGFHKNQTPGALIERVDGDVGTLANFFARFVTELLANFLLVIGILIVFYTIDWRVGLAETIFALLTLFVIIRLRNIAVPHNRAARQAAAELFGFLEERLSGTEDVRANGAVDYVMRRLYKFSRQRMGKRVKAAAIGVSSFSAANFLFVKGHIISLAAL